MGDRPGTWPPANMLDDDCRYHWLHAERSSAAAIAQWSGNVWYVIGETSGVSPRDMRHRGWEYLGPCERPHSHYLDD